MAVTVLRSWAVALALFILCLADATAWAQPPVSVTALQLAADATPRTRRSCAAIATLADRGARALRTADLIRRDAPIDLRNDGHPRKVLRLDDLGTAHDPYLADEAHQPIGWPDRADYFEVARWATEVVVLSAEQRTWRVDWDAGSLDNAAALVAATDGTAMCRFHTAWQAPAFKLLPEGMQGQARTYRALLLGHGSAPAPADVDLDVVQRASDLPPEVAVQAPSWRADLLNNGQQLTLIRVLFASGAGRGCDYGMLGLIEADRVIATGFGEYGNGIARHSPMFEQLVYPVLCSGVMETPLLDDEKRAYVLFDNTAKVPDRAERVRLLAGARSGTMRALARLSWKTRNDVLPPNPP